MSRLFFTVMMVGLLVAVPASAEKPNPADFYKLQFDGKISAGAPGNLQFTVVGINGYKWNKEFPAKLKLETADSALVLPSKSYRQIPNKDNWEKGVKVAATANKAGEYPLTATMSFSVCKKDVCRLFRNQKFSVRVKAK